MLRGKIEAAIARVKTAQSQYAHQRGLSDDNPWRGDTHRQRASKTELKSAMKALDKLIKNFLA